eukprot:ANDGO_02029.mRNA.1 hypothetical protein
MALPYRVSDVLSSRHPYSQPNFSSLRESESLDVQLGYGNRATERILELLSNARYPYKQCKGSLQLLRLECTSSEARVKLVQSRNLVVLNNLFLRLLHDPLGSTNSAVSESQPYKAATRSSGASSVDSDDDNESENENDGDEQDEEGAVGVEEEKNSSGDTFADWSAVFCELCAFQSTFASLSVGAEELKRIGFLKSLKQLVSRPNLNADLLDSACLIVEALGTHQAGVQLFAASCRADNADEASFPSLLLEVLERPTALLETCRKIVSFFSQIAAYPGSRDLLISNSAVKSLLVRAEMCIRDPQARESPETLVEISFAVSNLATDASAKRIFAQHTTTLSAILVECSANRAEHTMCRFLEMVCLTAVAEETKKLCLEERPLLVLKKAYPSLLRVLANLLRKYVQHTKVQALIVQALRSLAEFPETKATLYEYLQLGSEEEKHALNDLVWKNTRLFSAFGSSTEELKPIL